MTIYKKLSYVNRDIKEAIIQDKIPEEIFFQESYETPKYRITIEEVKSDYFIDSKGQKWIRSKEDTNEEDTNENN